MQTERVIIPTFGMPDGYGLSRTYLMIPRSSTELYRIENHIDPARATGIPDRVLGEAAATSFIQAALTATAQDGMTCS